MTPSNGLFRCFIEKRPDGDAISVRHVPDEPKLYKPQNLVIEFNRTIRVPDNADESSLPPSLGTFPLLKVHDFASKLPSSMAVKGGVFFPMYQREAMWICFTATRPFMIKIYAGGINVVSGEPKIETLETGARRRDLIAQGESIQDYVVAPPQPWIDGFAVEPGVVRQFVAMPLGEGYTVEAQLTGKEVVGGLQFEITPSRPVKRKYRKRVDKYSDRPYPFKPCTPSGDYSIIVKTLTGKKITVPCSPYDKVGSVKLFLQDTEGIRPDHQRLIFGPKELVDREILGTDYGIENGSTVHFVLNLRGGGCEVPEGPMGIAAGGMIDQAIEEDTHDPNIWTTTSTMTIPVHILTTTEFCRVTGRDPPPCPISASTYANAGLPFFDLPEKPTNVSGDFNTIKSVNETDQDRGLAQRSEPSVHPRLIKLLEERKTTGYRKYVDLSTLEDPDHLLDPSGPLRGVRTLTDMLKRLERGDL